MKIRFLRSVGRSLVRETELKIPAGIENETAVCPDDAAEFLINKGIAVRCDDDDAPKIARAQSAKLQGQ